MTENEVLTFDEFIDFLKIGRNTGYKLLNSGEIQARRLGKQWRVSRLSVLNWLNSA